MATLLEIDKTQVELYSITEVTTATVAATTTTEVTTATVAATTTTTPAPVHPRLLKGAKQAANPAGKVKVNFKVTDPKGKMTPKDVAKIAKGLPAQANKNLQKNGVPTAAKVGKAQVTPVTLAKKPADPCAPVVTPKPVAPANPCAPVVPAAPAAPAANPCAVVGVGVKYNENTPEVPAVNTTGLSAMLLFGVPSLLGMVLLVRKFKNRSSRDAAILNSDEESPLVE
jgi:hypothetical protein